MLPSMPLLMTPMKELGDDSSSSSDDSPTLHSIENGSSEHLDSANRSTTGNPVDNAGQCGDGRALPSQEGNQAREKSCSPGKRSSSEPTSAQKKKKKTQHKKILAALTSESKESIDASAQSFAEAYFQKVRERLDDEKWALFLQELVGFEETQATERRPVELYRKMALLLEPHADLVEEFLKFLLPHQALELDRVMAYLSLDKMSEFFRKLNILLMKRQVRQVYAALECLTVMPNVTLADVKDTILPLIKSSALLTSLFLALLPGERPPDSLMTDFEQVDLKEESEVETVIVPDCPDPYGSENCICHCHQSQTRHCVTCGIKYLNGRVYIQCGKALRPAKVLFKDKKHLDLLKWEGEKNRNRRRLMPKTLVSPSSIEHRLNIDSEDDCGAKKSPRTPRMRVARPKVKKHVIENKDEVLEGIFPLSEPKIGDKNAEGLADNEMKHDGIDDNDFDEIVLENECNTEEDEEEFLNKGLHSENESSIEAEDIGKELECSFEDEEVDYFDNSEIDNCEHDFERAKSTNEESNNSHCENSSKSVGMGIGSLCEENAQDMNGSVETSSAVKNNFGCINDMKIEPRSVSSTHEVEDVVKEELEPYSIGSNIDIKMEEEEEIIDTCEGDSLKNVEEEKVDKCDHSSLDKASVSGSNIVDSSFKEWTKEEDKIILLTFQHESGLEQTFKTASLQLPNRSQEEIQQRFEVLLKLLKEMYPNNETPNN